MLVSGFRNEPGKVRGTGVLVTLLGRYFVLTAGHCVSDLKADIDRNAFGLGLLGNRRGIAPAVIERAFDDKGDVGAIEISAVDARQIRDLTTNYFLRADELAIGEVDHVAPIDDAYVVAGYPKPLFEDEHDGPWIIQTGSLATTMSHRFVATLGVTRRIELPYGSTEALNTSPERLETIAPIDLAGCSGGGCWAMGMSPGWTTERLRLIAIHSGRRVDDAGIRLQEILAGHHLSLIATKFRGMGRLFDDYPAIRDWCG